MDDFFERTLDTVKFLKFAQWGEDIIKYTDEVIEVCNSEEDIHEKSFYDTVGMFAIVNHHFFVDLRIINC